MGSTHIRNFAAAAAFVCFFATLPIYSPNIVALNAAGVPQVTSWFSRGVLAFALLASILTVPMGRSGGAARRCRAQVGSNSSAPHTPRVGRSHEPGLSPAASVTPVSLAAASAYFVGGAGYTALVALGADVASPVVDALGVASSALAGLTTVPLCIAWSKVFSHERLVRLVALCGVGIAAAALVNLAVSALPVPASYAVHALLLAVGSCSPFTLARADVRDAAAATPSAAFPSRLNLRPFVSVMGTPLLGIAVSSFVIGIAPTTVFAGHVDTQVVGSIAAGVIAALVCACARRCPVPTPALIQRLLIPLAAAAALAICAFPAGDQDTQAIVSYTLFSLVGAVALAMGSGISNAREFPREAVFATIVGVYCVAAVAGLVAGTLFSDTATYHFKTIAALMAIYGVFAIATACLRAAKPAGSAADDELLGGAESDAGTADPSGKTAQQNRGESGAGPSASRPSANGGPGSSTPIEARVELLAARFTLTPRETEIVHILARGHGCAYVAETLLISKSTVYTHVRNVYRKLDVSNHDELIARIYEQG